MKSQDHRDIPRDTVTQQRDPMLKTQFCNKRDRPLGRKTDRTERQVSVARLQGHVIDKETISVPGLRLNYIQEVQETLPLNTHTHSKQLLHENPLVFVSFVLDTSKSTRDPTRLRAPSGPYIDGNLRQGGTPFPRKYGSVGSHPLCDEVPGFDNRESNRHTSPKSSCTQHKTYVKIHIEETSPRTSSTPVPVSPTQFVTLEDDIEG